MLTLRQSICINKGLTLKLLAVRFFYGSYQTFQFSHVLRITFYKRKRVLYYNKVYICCSKKLAWFYTTFDSRQIKVPFSSWNCSNQCCVGISGSAGAVFVDKLILKNIDLDGWPFTVSDTGEFWSTFCMSSNTLHYNTNQSFLEQNGKERPERARLVVGGDDMRKRFWVHFARAKT